MVTSARAPAYAAPPAISIATFSLTDHSTQVPSPRRFATVSSTSVEGVPG